MSLVHQLATLVAPWADFYNDSKVAQTAVTFGHFGGMITAGGLALAADRATLRAPAKDLSRQLRELAGVHPIVIAALAVTVLSGLLMLGADLENLIASPAFWIKMALFGALLLNGGLMLRAERAVGRAGPADSAGRRRLRAAAIMSVVLWFAVVLAGSVLPNVT
ncbi:MAG TPA: hypothetical protein VH879_07040 [Gemmatimonadales bacterium]|jgi:hypothetical protein